MSPNYDIGLAKHFAPAIVAMLFESKDSNLFAAAITKTKGR
jgi:hypothetical protein